MNMEISKQIAAFGESEQLHIHDAREALENGRATCIEFSADGLTFKIIYNYYDGSGALCTTSRCFPMAVAALVFAGHRLQSHNHPTCM